MPNSKESRPTEVDAVVVGAGFAGLYALHRLREIGCSVRVLERGSGVGGTWYWNRYPGARCDVESLQYSYQFDEDLQQEWKWSERYSPQPEILAYVNHVADRFDLRRNIQFDTSVTAAHWDESAARWQVETDAGDRLSASFCIMATGCLSSPNTPEFPGASDFEGAIYHTGQWPHEGVDFSGQRVAIIGTGSSAIQSIPLIAEEARDLYVFQRTPNYTIPAHNSPLDAAYEARIKADYPAFRRYASQQQAGLVIDYNDEACRDATPEQRERIFQERWAQGGLAFLTGFKDLGKDAEMNELAAEFVRSKIREVVKDPEVASLLSPDQVIGCKRLCVDSSYWETFNRPNVRLLDAKTYPIRGFTRLGLRSGDREYELDSIVLATGFDAMTGSLLRIDIRGRAGVRLQKAWEAGPRTYLGLGTVGFPNLFTITGPGSPSVLSNMLPAIEQHVNWITDCVQSLRDRGIATIEPTLEAQDAWVEHVNELAEETLYPRCNSWYLGANIPGKPRVFMPYLGFPQYVEKCDEVAANHYEGFALEKR